MVDVTDTAVLIEAIAAALGASALRHRPDDDGYVTNAGFIMLDRATDPRIGPALHVTVGSWRKPGMVTLRPVYPQDADWRSAITPDTWLPYAERGNWTHAINVSRTKTPVQMARDIERRLLPDYRANYTLAIGYVVERDAKRNTQQTARDRLASIFPDATAPGWYRDDDKRRMFTARSGGVTIKAEVSHDGQTVYQLEVAGLPVDDAEHLLRALRELSG